MEVINARRIKISRKIWRFKEEVKEVKNGFECGVMLENYSDIKIGDVIETFEEVKTDRKL